MTYGDLAARVGEELGMPPDDDQRDILDAVFAEDVPGVPAVFEVAVVAPRQNIKTSTLEIAALTDLFVLGVERHIWTAHLFKTARSTFEHMAGLIESAPDFRRRCRQPRTAHGDEAIELRSGQRIEFHARSTGGGRGQVPPPSRITLDEGLFLSATEVGALVPTLATRRDAQIRHGSSAGLPRSDVLRGLRGRGRRGGDGSLAYFEWGAPRKPCTQDRCTHSVGADGCALDDRGLWAAANPALGRRITEETLLNFRRSMPPIEFAREFLSWWEDPPNADGDGDLDVARWLSLVDVTAEPDRPLVFGIDQGEDRLVSIGCAWRRPDRRVHVMLTQDERVDVGLSPAEAVARLAALRKRWRGRVLLGGPAVGLEQDLRAAGVPSEVVSGSQFATACGQLDDRLRDGELRHGNQRELNESIGAVRWRKFGTAGERTFELSGAPGVGPTAAVVRALHGLLSRSGPVASPVVVEAHDVPRVPDIGF